MTKKHFIALADKIRETPGMFSHEQLEVLATFCREQNPNFNRTRWILYIDGECGPSGGKVK